MIGKMTQFHLIHLSLPLPWPKFLKKGRENFTIRYQTVEKQQKDQIVNTIITPLDITHQGGCIRLDPCRF